MINLFEFKHEFFQSNNIFLNSIDKFQMMIFYPFSAETFNNNHNILSI